jgi:hypothetical protein
MIVSPGMGMRAPVMTPAPMSMETPTTTYGEFLCVIPLRPPQAAHTLTSCPHTMTVCCALSLAEEYIKHRQRRNQAYPNSTAVVVDTDVQKAGTLGTTSTPYGASSAITIDDAPPPLVHPKLLTSVRRPIVSTMTVCCALSLAEEYIKYRQRRDEDDSPSTSAALHTDVQKAAADTLSTTSNLYGESSRPLRSPLKNTPVSHQLRRFTQRVSCNLSRRGIHEDQTAQ